LAQGRTIKLQESFDFIFGEVLVVNAHEFVGYLIGVKSLLVTGGEGIYKSLPFVVVGHGREQLFPRLLNGVVGSVCDHIARPGKFHERTNVRLFQRIDVRIRLRSEERRVGKECTYRWAPYYRKQKCCRENE